MKTILLALCVAMGFCATAQNFGTGNFVLFRAGDGTTDLTANGNKIFLDEYTIAGVLVRSIEMPSTNDGVTNNNIVTNGTNNNEGFINRSPNGLFLALAGYNPTTVPFSASVFTNTVPRVLVSLNNAATISSFSVTDWATTAAARSAITTDGVQFWLGGNPTGVSYRSTSASSTVTLHNTASTSFRDVIIANGNLYGSTGTATVGRIGQIGTGLPTTASQTYTPLPGYALGTLPNQFVLLDLNPTVSGVDVMYVAEEAGGIKKYSFDGSTWTSNGAIGTAADVYRGLIASVTGSVVTLFATSMGGSTAGGGGQLVTAIDAGGYNVAPTSTTVTILQTATTTSKIAFRGLAWAPTATALPVNLQSFNARLENGTAKLWWATSNAINAKKFEIEKSNDGNSFTYLSSVTATNGSSLISYTFDDASLTGTIAYYRLKIIDNDGTFAYSKIVSVSTNATSNVIVRVANNPVIGNVLRILHNSASKISNINIFTASGILVKSFKVAFRNQQSDVDVASLPKGQYFIEYTDAENNVNATIKFIK